MKITEKIAELGIIPVVKIDDADKAVALGQALLNANLSCIEITFRTDAAAASIKAISSALPGLLVGAGTVLTIKQVDEAITSGAKFIVTPGFNPEVVSYCIEKDIQIIPGCSCASDIEAALSYDLKVVKFFPAEQLGGLPMIKALAAPYGNVKFIATGGINDRNFRAYLDFSKVIAIAGSWMVLPELIENGNFAEIEKLSKEAIKTMLDINISKVSLSAETNDEIISNISKATNGIISESSGKQTNVITISTVDIKRAEAYFKLLGLNLEKDLSSESTTIENLIFKDSVSKFEIKLVQK